MKNAEGSQDNNDFRKKNINEITEGAFNFRNQPRDPDCLKTTVAMAPVAPEQDQYYLLNSMTECYLYLDFKNAVI